MLSNCYKPFDPSSTITHWYSARKGEPGYPGKIQKIINFPPMIKFYRLFMGAVDTFDQFRAYIKLDLRSTKFWHPMFFFIIESAMINAWVLYKCTRELANLPLQYDHVQFRRSVALSLAAEWEAMGCCVGGYAEGSAASPTTKLKNVLPGKRVRLVPDSSASVGLFPSNHLDFCEKIPLKEGSNRKQRQHRCLMCKKRTSFWCSANSCKIPLCKEKRFCFVKYHADGLKTDL